MEKLYSLRVSSEKALLYERSQFKSYTVRKIPVEKLDWVKGSNGKVYCMKVLTESYSILYEGYNIKLYSMRGSNGKLY
jgi:hypothetical protein